MPVELATCDLTGPQPYGAAAIFSLLAAGVSMPSLRVFVALCVATASVAVCVAALRANEVMDFWRDEYQRRSRASAAPIPSQPRSYEAQRPTTRTKLTVWPKRPETSTRPESIKRREASRDESSRRGRGRASGGSLYCVRTCDGFYFPATASASTADDGKICATLCPATETEAYRLAKDDDDIDNAVTRKGKPYSSLPAAFAYRTSLKQGCTCGDQARTAIAALQDDPTLAPNDIVVTETGVRVFVGSSKFPYREKDFVPYRKVRRMERGLAAYLESIEHPLGRSESRRSSGASGAPHKNGVSKSRSDRAESRAEKTDRDVQASVR